MITLQSLEWSNVFSYGANNKIDLCHDPLVQLVGLNGRGKSSIPLIIEEVLFNKNSKGVKKGAILNRYVDTNKYYIKLIFSVFSDEYALEVNRTGATQKVKLSKNGSDISSHTATDTFKLVESILGIDAKTFSQVVYQNNSSSLQFLTATDTNRKKFLIDLLNLDRYVSLFETFKLVHKKVADKLLVNQTKKDSITTWISKHNSKDNLVMLDLVEIPEFDTSLSIRLNELESSVKDIVTTNNKITQNEQYKTIRDRIVMPDFEIPEEVSTKELVAEQTTINFRIKQLTTEIKTYSNKATNKVCGTCGQNIDTSNAEEMLKSFQSELSVLKERKLVIDEQIESINTSNDKIKESKKLISDFEKYSALIDSSLPTILLDKDSITSEIAELTTKISSQKAEIKRLQEANDKANKNNSQVELILQQLEKFEQELSLVTIELDELETTVSYLEILKKAFSTNGLLAYKIENSVKDLEYLTNEYLTELSDGRFQLTFSIVNDKLNVIIIDNGIEIEISALSSGELARVTTATLLAIRKLMSSISKSRINILFLDETIDTLDTYGKEKLIEVLLKEDNLNTFLISHGYQHPLLKKLTVIKEDNISRIEEE